MNRYKKQIIIFLVIPTIFFLVLEFLYTYFPIATNSSEVRIIEINNIKNEELKYAIFGSSVSNGVLGSNPNVYNNVYNGTTVGATTLMGQYFLAKRLLNNNKVEQIFLSFTPHMLFFDITNKNNKRVVRFFNDSFKNSYEENILKKFDKNYTIENSYIINRRFYINNLIKEQKQFFNEDKIARKIDDILNRKLQVCQKENDKKVQEEILNHSNSIYNAKLNPHIPYLFQLISEQSLQDKFIFIIEPMPKSVYEKFIKSDLYFTFIKELEHYHIKYIDSNNNFEFNDCMFRDHLHLKNQFNINYEQFLIKTLFNNILEYRNK